MRRDDVTSASVRHHFDVMCLLGSVGIWYQNNVVSTSMRRHHVTSTLIRCHFTSCARWMYVPLPLKQNKSYVLTSYMKPFSVAKFEVAEMMTTTTDPDAIKCYLRKYTKEESLNFQRLGLLKLNCRYICL